MNQDPPEATPVLERYAPTWEIAHAAIMVSAMLAAALSRRSGIVAVVGLALLAHRVGRERHRWLPMRFGWPNAITSLRAVLVALLACGGDPREMSAGTAALAWIVWAIDGLDGWLARRLNATSEFGASFDMEVDAFYIAMLSAVLAASGAVGFWVLTAGLLRYVYFLVVALCPWARGEVPRNRFARSIFGLLANSLCLALLPFPWLSAPVAAIGTALVTLSFAHSFWWSFRGAPPVTPVT